MLAQILRATIILIVLESPGLFCQASKAPDSAFISSVDTALQKLTQMHQEVRGIHPYLAHLHPIAVVKGDSLFIFDGDSLDQEYRFQKKEPVPFPMDKGIRASFPLASYGGKPTCVVSREVFDSLKGYARIFHEFIHCTQYLTCENRLKQKLQIAQAADRTKNYSWEINHLFPYEDAGFVKDYSMELRALADHDSATVLQFRQDLKQQLPHIDYEYMVWVEWKEGFARFIENEIRSRYGIGANYSGEGQPYNRVTFYYGGEKFIRFLVQNGRDRLIDVECLFQQMLKFGGPE
jgi:hypothetical protein